MLTFIKMEFSQLDQGDLFILEDDQEKSICMKTEKIINYANQWYTVECNAVNLSNGALWAVEDEEWVIPIDGNLEIGRA